MDKLTTRANVGQSLNLFLFILLVCWQRYVQTTVLTVFWCSDPQSFAVLNQRFGQIVQEGLSLSQLQTFGPIGCIPGPDRKYWPELIKNIYQNWLKYWPDWFKILARIDKNIDQNCWKILIKILTIIDEKYWPELTKICPNLSWWAGSTRKIVKEGGLGKLHCQRPVE